MREDDGRDATTSYDREDDDELVVLLGEGDRGARQELWRRVTVKTSSASDDGEQRAGLLGKVYRRLSKELKKIEQKKMDSSRWDQAVRTTLDVAGWPYEFDGPTAKPSGGTGEEELPALLELAHAALVNHAYARSACLNAQSSSSCVSRLLLLMRRVFTRTPEASITRVSQLCLNASLVDLSLARALEHFPDCVTCRVLVCLCHLLGDIALFDCSTKEAWSWVREVTELGGLGRREAAAWRLLMLSTLSRVLEGAKASEPASAFALSGSLGGIICDGCAKWPFNNGFCFLSQICIDRFGDNLDYKPRLFTFVTSDGQGIEGFFEGPFLVVAFHTGRTARSEVVHFKHAFRPRSWYTVAVQVEKPSIVKGGKSKLSLWVDGTVMDTHSVGYKKIHKPLSAFCIGTRPPAIRGNNSFLNDADDNRRFNFKGLLGPVHVYHHCLSDAYLKRTAGPEASCLPNHVLRISQALGSSLGRRRSFSGEAKGSFSNLLAFYHPLLVKGSVCANAVGLDLNTLSDYRQNQAHLSASVTVCRRSLAISSFAACGRRLPRHLISILSEKAFLKDVRSGEENVVVVGIASHVVSILAKAATASASAGEGYLGGDVPPLLGGTVLQAIDRLTQREEDAPAVISGLLTSVSDLMGNASNWAQFAECLLFNRRVWEKAPGECKVHLLYVISRYCEMHPRQMLEMGVASVLFSYLSECTFEHRRGILKDGIFNSTFQACSKCIKLLVLSGVEASQEDLRDLVSGCVAFLSSLQSLGECEHLIFLFEEVFADASADLRRNLAKCLVQEKFVEVALGILSAQSDKASHQFCKIVMNHTVPLFSEIFSCSQAEADSQFAESYYTMSTLIRMAVFGEETSGCIGASEYCSIMCSSLTNLEGARRHSREEVLSGTCVLKNMMFLSPFVLGLHRLSPTIQEHALHDLTFLFCTNAENRRVFTSWDEWYVGVIFVYLEAWSEGREQIIDSCINLIQVLAQHAYRGKGFSLFAHQVVCSSLVVRTGLYEEHLSRLGSAQDVNAKVDEMTSCVIRKLLSFAMEDLLIDQKPKGASPAPEVCELNSLSLLILIDRYLSVQALGADEDGKIDVAALSALSAGDWVMVGPGSEEAAPQPHGECSPAELASSILRKVVDHAPLLPERSRVDLLCAYGSNAILRSLLGRMGRTFHDHERVDHQILDLAMRNLGILLKRNNLVRHAYKERQSHLVLIPLVRLVLVSIKLGPAGEGQERLAFLQELARPILSEPGEKHQALAFAMSVLLYEEGVLALSTEGYPLDDLLTLLIQLVQRWQTMLQDNLAVDSPRASREIHQSPGIGRLPAPLVLAQQNLLSLSPVAVGRALGEVLRVGRAVLGSEELSEALSNLLTVHEIKRAHHLHETFLCGSFRASVREGGFENGAEPSSRELSATLKERKQQNSARLHKNELANQESLQLSNRLLLELLNEISFEEQSTRDPSDLGLGPNAWKVEATENSCRKRQRLALCSRTVEYQPASDKPVERDERSILDMENLLPVSKSVAFFEEEEEEEEEELNNGNSSPQSSQVLTSPGGSRRGTELGEDRKMKLEAFALLVTPKGTSLGWVEINRHEFRFTAVDTEQEMAAHEEEGRSLPMSYMRSFLDEESHGDRGNRVVSWPLESLLLILVRRYCLRRSAVEVFLADRTSYFLDFGSPDLRQSAYQALVSAKPRNLHPLCYHSQNPERLVKKSEITDRWVRREITNFEYLMHLNTFAGRSYNDITQYPIFPWVLCDYESEEIDLDDPKSYRDLSKPVGALDDDRLKKFVERYDSFEDDVMPKFHYGSHYSSSGIVLYYLLRLEPFAGLAVSLQGGKFDHADRLFDDLPGTWRGVLSDMSDVKELIPEFYYCPEIFQNVNGFNLGTRQDGKVLGDVTLPPWAKDAHDFVAKNRRALESEHVSARLHEWVDLIFGCKQRGERAETAHNVFFYMTYEGQVDIDAITDPTQQKAALDQIAHFGQTPYQLFKQSHPSRMPLEECVCPLFTTPSAVKSYEVDGQSGERTSVGQMRLTSESIVMVSSLYPYQVSVLDFKANTPDSSGLPFSGRSKSKAFTAITTLSQKLSAVTNLLDSGLSAWSSGLDSGLSFKDCVAMSENGRHIFCCGYHDYTIRFCDTHAGKSIEVLRGTEQPTCLRLSQCGSVLAVGFRNSTVGVWVVQPSLRQAVDKDNNADSFFFNTAAVTDWLLQGRPSGEQHLQFVNTLSLCCGAVKCLDVNTDLDTVAALTFERELVLHSLAGASFSKVDGVEAENVQISNDGFVVVCNPKESKISCFSLNGLLLRKFGVPDLTHLEPLALSNRGRYLAVSGGLRPGADKVCRVLVYDLVSIEVVLSHDLETFVSSCAFSKDDTNLVAVMDAGEVMVFTDPATSLKLVDQMLRLGWQESGLEALQ